VSGPLAAATVPDDVAAQSRRLRLETDQFDRTPGLLAQETRVLEELDLRQLRRNRARGIPRRTAAQWTALERLVGPLDAALAALHHDEHISHRRAGTHAVAVVLQHCAATSRAFWGWTAWDWAQVCGPSSEAFRAAQPLPTETTVRPFVIALGYLLGEFTDFQHLGNFNRLHLARLSSVPSPSRRP